MRQVGSKVCLSLTLLSYTVNTYRPTLAVVAGVDATVSATVLLSAAAVPLAVITGIMSIDMYDLGVCNLAQICTVAGTIPCIHGVTVAV